MHGFALVVVLGFVVAAPVARSAPRSGLKDAAVVVGTRYHKLPDDGTFYNDGVAWRQLLTGTAGVPDDKEHLAFLDQADARQVLREIDRLGQVATDTLWIIMAAHGAGDLLFTWAAPANAEGAINDHALSRQQIVDAAARSQAKRVVVILDACRSGKDRSGNSIDGLRFAINSSHRLRIPYKVAIWSAAGEDEYARSLPEKRQGLFSYHAIRALGGQAADAQGQVSLSGAHRYVAEQLVSALSRSKSKQHPELSRADDTPLVAVRPPDPPFRAGPFVDQARGWKAEQRQAEHRREVERAWHELQPLVRAGGRPAQRAIRALMDELKGHALGNPLHAEMQAALERAGRAPEPFRWSVMGALGTGWGSFQQSGASREIEGTVNRFDLSAFVEPFGETWRFSLDLAAAGADEGGLLTSNVLVGGQFRSSTKDGPVVGFGGYLLIPTSMVEAPPACYDEGTCIEDELALAKAWQLYSKAFHLSGSGDWLWTQSTFGLGGSFDFALGYDYFRYRKLVGVGAQWSSATGDVLPMISAEACAQVRLGRLWLGPGFGFSLAAATGGDLGTTAGVFARSELELDAVGQHALTLEGFIFSIPDEVQSIQLGYRATVW